MKKFNAPIILASVLFLLLAGWSILNRDTPSIHAENGIMENIQLALLFLASVVYFTAFFNGEGTPRLIPLFLSALSVLFIFRELDFESFTDNHLIIMFGNGIGRNIIMTAMLSGILLMALFKHKTYIPGSLKFVKSKAGISLITGGHPYNHS